MKSSPDPHGYQRLFRSLEFIAKECREAGASAAARELERAMAFFGTGSASEYLGEASIALAVAARTEPLPPSVRAFASAVESEIRSGWNRLP